MKNNKIVKLITVVMIMAMTLTMLTGCESLNSGIQTMKGDLMGNEFVIDTFDNFGKKVMQTHGEKINITPNIVEVQSYGDGGWMTTKDLSAAITININGKQMVSCGDTMIFYDSALKPEYDFSVENIESQSNGIMDNTIIAGMVNRVKNSFGKSVVVVIKSQTGYPLYAFSGESVYWDIPDDLPKFTKLSVDGHPMYIHRANFQIIDKSLLN